MSSNAQDRFLLTENYLFQILIVPKLRIDAIMTLYKNLKLSLIDIKKKS